MRFGDIYAFHYIWLIVGLTAFYIWAFKRRQKKLEVFAHKELFIELLTSLNTKKQRLKALLFMFSLVIIVFSLMRPQWGFHWQEIKRRGLDIVIAVDTSKSMLAEDVKPNRLERTKLAVKDFVKNLRGDRVGLIAFAGSAFVQCPLTIDYKGFLLSLKTLSVDTIPKGGTSISEAIREAIKIHKGGLKKYKVLILITDGEDHGGNPIKAAEEAKKNGMKIFTIGIGTKEGELIPLTDEKGMKSYLKDREGKVVKSRLDETTLQKIALTTGGSYVRSGRSEFGLNLIYEQKLSKMEKREIESKMAKHYDEKYQIFLFCALLLLMIEVLISERKRGIRS